MSRTRAATVAGERGEPGGLSAVPAAPRVRHLARDAAGLMVFSAATSTTLAGCLLLLTMLGHQG